MSRPPAAARAAQSFSAVFGGQPRFVGAAPGRVNLIGEHTDYNDGFVLPMAIGLSTVCAGAPASGSEVRIHSAMASETVSFDAGAPVGPGGPAWASYLRGVVAGFQRRGVAVPGLQIVVESDVPPGGGLSSSAALEVSMASLLESATGRTLEPLDKVRLCREAEHEFAGVPCGIMDQMVVVFGRVGEALLIDCRSNATTRVPFDDPMVSVLVVNTNVRHELAAGEYARRRAECEEAARAFGVPALRDVTAAMLERAPAALEPTILARARHVVTENARTLEAVDALGRRDWARMGALLYASHESLRDDYAVSCAELDAVVDIARAIGAAGGVWGCRMTGGGFGGCAVALVETRRLDDVGRRVAEAYRSRTGRDATLFPV